jgi:hypothetical protein
MENELSLYNHYHNGDVFYARTILQNLNKKFRINFFHNLSHGLLEDLENCVEYSNSPIPNQSINTWLGQHGELDENGCSFSAHKKLASKILNDLEIFLPNDEDFLPVINFDRISDKERIDDLVKEISKMAVLISNGQVLSSQSNHIDFESIINEASEKFPEIIFITTHPTSINKKNVYYSYNFTKKLPDLLLISYLSTYCKIIIGRPSGPYCYTHIKENLMDENKTFISFSIREHEGKWYCNSKAKQIWTDNTDINYIIEIVNNEIQNRIDKL